MGNSVGSPSAAGNNRPSMAGHVEPISSGHASKLAPGDRVVWTFRPSGAYGRAMGVAAVVCSVGDSSVTITVVKRVQGDWLLENRVVATRHLSARSAHVPEVDGQTDE